MKMPNRKPTRLSGYDYSNQNYYFVTICTHNRQNIFATVGNGLDRSDITLNTFGEFAKTELLNIQNHFDDIKIDKYIIMPNHIHAIIIIGCNGNAERSRPFPTLSTVIGLYKSGVSKRIHQTDPNIIIWQKSFNDRIIRNEQEYQKIWQYIDTNPMKRETDYLYIK